MRHRTPPYRVAGNGRRARASALGEVLTAVLIVVTLYLVLFPYFHQQPLIRRNSDLSNIKQIGLSLAMYENDYDNRVVPLGSYTGPANIGVESVDGRPAYVTWAELLYPYCRYAGIYVSQYDPDFDKLGPDPQRRDLLFMSYGYNYAYLNPHTPRPYWDSPTNETRGKQTRVKKWILEGRIIDVSKASDPTTLLAFASRTHSYSIDNRQLYSFGTTLPLLNLGEVEPPVMNSKGLAPGSPCYDVRTMSSWGRDNTWLRLNIVRPEADGALSGLVGAPIMDRTAVSYADGHAKWVPTNSLADGTNVSFPERGAAIGDYPLAKNIEVRDPRRYKTWCP